MNEKRLYIIDGHAVIFKMYYALQSRPMINSKGIDTSILYGFTKYLFEILHKQNPSHIAVCFDPSGHTFRNDLYPEYKANRKETPSLVIEALEPLCEICKALRIPVIMKIGYEADDVAGTIAKRAEKEGFTVYMVTPDKDYGQLISEHIFQYKPGKKGGDDEILGVAEVCEKYGIDYPQQVIEILTLCGDSSDNVPGVKGVGEVGAAKLLKQFGTVENIYQHLEQLTPRQKDMFLQAQDHIKLSHELVTIKTDVPVEFSFEEMQVREDYDAKIVELFDFYEFSSLKKHICHVTASPASCSETKWDDSYINVKAEEVIRAAQAEGLMALRVGNDDKLCVATRKNGQTICANAPAQVFAPLLLDKHIVKIGFDLKALWRKKIAWEGKCYDLELMHYLLNPERSHSLESQALEFLHIDLQDKFTAQTGDLFAMEEESEDTDHEAYYTVITLLLHNQLLKELEKKEVLTLYTQIEEPLIRVLAEMEQTGVKVDLDSLKEFANQLRKEVEEKESLIRELTGEPDLNCSSPKQVAIVLYEKLKINPKAKAKGRNNYPTDEETLSALADKHPSIVEILEYRAVKKLLSTYIDPFPHYVSPESGRIHTTFNQALTATGRLSSSKPNLQNIPIRTERGQNIRKAFISDREDGLIISADYSQIELRIMAHLCGDEHLCEAFLKNEDVHSATAAKIFGVDIQEVSAQQRRIAKTANFGIMYGISSFGLAQRLKIDRSQAQQIINDYFASFPAIAAYMDRVKKEAHENGYVETIFGRKRYLPDLRSHNANIRNFAERNAINAPIQGSSADIIKMAMVKVSNMLKEKGFRSKMILQIHDELLFDAYPEEVVELKKCIKEAMENIVQLSVPLVVECSEGKNWFEAH